MKKLIVLFIGLIVLSTLFVISLPPGEHIYNEYVNSIVNSKAQFRSRKQFDTELAITKEDDSGGSTGTVNVGAYTEVPVPYDLSKESLTNWLNKLSICPERRSMLEFEISNMGNVPYTYGGEGRARYRQDVSEWGNGTDCSGIVTAALYRGGFDYGVCFSTTSLYDKFKNNQVDTLMPGDISVVSGKHTELYLGKQEDGSWVHIGVRSHKDPPGPSATVNHTTLTSSRAIHVRPPELQECDNKYYSSGSNSMSNYNMPSMLSETKVIMNQFIEACKDRGVNVKIVSDLRTREEQDEIYEKGRTTSGDILTNDKGSNYESLHQWGLAFDVCQDDNDTPYPQDNEFWDTLYSVANKLGLSYGDSNCSDSNHFYISTYSSASELKNKYKTPYEMYIQVEGK